jgi:hypothetical protein
MKETVKLNRLFVEKIRDFLSQSGWSVDKKLNRLFHIENFDDTLDNLSVLFQLNGKNHKIVLRMYFVIRFNEFEEYSKKFNLCSILNSSNTFAFMIQQDDFSFWSIELGNTEEDFRILEHWISNQINEGLKTYYIFSERNNQKLFSKDWDRSLDRYIGDNLKCIVFISYLMKLGKIGHGEGITRIEQLKPRLSVEQRVLLEDFLKLQTRKSIN